MRIKSNASSGELNSPIYLANKKLCTEWDAYILNKKGNLKGVYNSWSFKIKTIVKTNLTWRIEITKATYSGGNLLFSSKYQSLQEILTFTTIIPEIQAQRQKPTIRTIGQHSCGSPSSKNNGAAEFPQSPYSTCVIPIAVGNIVVCTAQCRVKTKIQISAINARKILFPIVNFNGHTLIYISAK
ncbi:MAG: hypothetical protein HRT57_08245 [Crocinitomicaceae bacterium]|nr:hypothetical protein [Crocinitomicaceae bacterium]